MNDKTFFLQVNLFCVCVCGECKGMESEGDGWRQRELVYRQPPASVAVSCQHLLGQYLTNWWSILLMEDLPEANKINPPLTVRPSSDVKKERCSVWSTSNNLLSFPQFKSPLNMVNITYGWQVKEPNCGTNRNKVSKVGSSSKRGYSKLPWGGGSTNGRGRHSTPAKCQNGRLMSEIRNISIWG